jgi:nucleotide-binding universal stress UspA family protein
MEEIMLKHIVFCTDFSDNADEAFAMAKDLAWRYGATLHIVHILVTFSYSPIGEVHVPLEYDAKFVERATDAARDAIRDRYIGLLKQKQPYEIILLSGYPASEIIHYAKEKQIDLIVMGCHGLTGLAHVLFGSTADRVVRKAPCSVLTVRLPKAD